MSHEQVINRIVELIIKLTDILKEFEGLDPNCVWQLHQHNETPEPYKPAKRIMDEIIDLVLRANGEMLSIDTIYTTLLYRTISVQLFANRSEVEFRNEVYEIVEKIISYKAKRDVDILIVSLDINDEQFNFGPVTFHPFSTIKNNDEWWERVKLLVPESMKEFIHCFLRTNVPGDSHRSVDNGLKRANEALLLLRGIGFPFTAENIHQFGIINEFPLWESVQIRLDIPKEAKKIEFHPKFVSDVRPPVHPCRLYEDIISKIEPRRLNLFLSFIDKHSFTPTGEIHERLISGFRWLGEATKPDNLEVRFAKIAFSLETFIGGEAKKNQYITTMGISSMLAERAAFLVGKDFQSRLRIDREIRKFYGKRSAISHGREAEIIPNDIKAFGDLVREIGWSLLEKSNEISTVGQLQKWVSEQRYYLP